MVLPFVAILKGYIGSIPLPEFPGIPTSIVLDEAREGKERHRQRIERLLAFKKWKENGDRGRRKGFGKFKNRGKKEEEEMFLTLLGQLTYVNAGYARETQK